MIRTANVQEPYSPAAFPSLQALYSPGPLGPFAVSTLPPAFLLFYHSGFENGSPRPIFRFGNLFRLREQSACEQNGAGGSRQGNGAGSPGQGSRAGAGREEEPDRAGQPDNTAQAKNGLVPAGDQAVPGGIQQKCLSFSKAA